MWSFRTSILVAAVAGCAAAIPVVLLMLGDVGWMDAPWGSVVVAPAAAVCPSWWLFWLVLGRPDDLQFVLKVSGLIVTLNALLFMPVGVLHGAMRGRRPAVRRAFTGAALIAMLALGPVFYMSEPEPLADLIWQLAA